MNASVIRKEFAVDWINRELADKRSLLMERYREINRQLDALNKEREEVSGKIQEIDTTLGSIKNKIGE